jgi:type II secretory pathway pseudopilin PulG
MRSIVLTAGALVALTLSSPVHAQDQESRITALERQINAAQSAIDQLRTELIALKAGSAASAEPASTPTASPVPAESASTTVAGFPREWGDRTWIPAVDGPGRGPARPQPERFASVNLIAGPSSGRAAFTLSSIVDRTGAQTLLTTEIVHDETSLEFSAPLAKKGDDDAPFATLDGLTSGTKLEFEFTRTHSRVLNEAGFDELPVIIRARALCEAASTQANPRNCYDFDPAFMADFFKEGDEDEFSRDLARRTLQQSWSWSLRGALGYDEFAYYPTPLLTKTTDEEVSGSVGGGLTIFPFDRTSVSFGLDYERSYDAGKAETTCPVPAPGATTITCVPGPLLPPELGDRLIFAPELRYLHRIEGNNLVRALAFAPRIEFDLLSSDVAFDLPIYFAADAKSGLTGGLRFGYTTEDDEFKFGVFVGKAFSLFP